MEFYYNPLDENCKSVRGGVREEQPFRIRLFCVENGKYNAPQNNAFLLIGKDGTPKKSYSLKKTEYGWTANVQISEKGLYYYCFYVEDIGFFVKNNRKNGKLVSYDTDNFLLIVSTADYHTPDWIKGGVMYQVFPDRFCKAGNFTEKNYKNRILREDWGGTPSYRPNEQGKILNNDFFGGNLQGIKSKLPYLKTLGISVIYLNPIFEAASNHRYDTSNYMKIDPLLGAEDDFQSLVDEAKIYGIRLILDGVFNHTGDDSVYFNKYGHYDSIGAYQSKESPYFSWYTFQKYPNKYDSWWGVDILPAVNENSKEYQNFILGENGVLKKWLSFGIGGYRLDVADELPDFFLQKLRTSVKEENQDALIIGEVWEDASDKISYSVRREYLYGEELDSVMNYPFRNAIIEFLGKKNSAYFAETIASIIDHYPKDTLDCLMNILGTHDTARILTIFGGKQANTKEEMALDNAVMTTEEKQSAIQKLKIAALLLYTLPGVPCIYYGDEIGMEGFGDPFCRRCFDELTADISLLEYYRLLGTIRRNYADVFSTGEYIEIYEKNGCIIYKRKGEQRSVYTCVNLSGNDYLLQLDNALDLIENRPFPQKYTLKSGEYALIATENRL